MIRCIGSTHGKPIFEYSGERELALDSARHLEIVLGFASEDTASHQNEGRGPSAAYSGTTVPPHEYFDRTRSRTSTAAPYVDSKKRKPHRLSKRNLGMLSYVVTARAFGYMDLKETRRRTSRAACRACLASGLSRLRFSVCMGGRSPLPAFDARPS